MQRSVASIAFQSARLQFAQVQVQDADELFDCISPAVAKHMSWEPPSSRAEFYTRIARTQRDTEHESYQFVVRRRYTHECIGKCAVDNVIAAAPEIGLWIKEDSHGFGYGTEIVNTIVDWAAEYLSKTALTYPVALGNIASLKIAEKLGGISVGTRTNPKYDSVVYTIHSGKHNRS